MNQATNLKVQCAKISTMLSEIQDECAAPESKVCLVIRHPSYPDGYLITSDDDLAEVKTVLERALSKKNCGEVFPFGRPQ